MSHQTRTARKASTPAPGRHRAEPGIADLLTPDYWEALGRVVIATGDEFHPHQWTFAKSRMLLTVATEQSSQHRQVVFSSDCRATLVREGESPSDAVARLHHTGTLDRFEIEWLLMEELPFQPRRPWHIVPLDPEAAEQPGSLAEHHARGWLCTYPRRLGRTRHYVISHDRRFARVETNDITAARAALGTLSP